jgi:FkbM family methyltransferase
VGLHFGLNQLALNLANSTFRQLFAVLATVGISIKRRSVNLFYVDGDGDWVNIQPDATFINPSYCSVRADEIREELQDTWCFEYKLRPGDLIVDIGAGVGDDVVFFSQLVGPTGRVIAVEPNPRIFRCLEKTVKANKLSNVAAVNMAICDHDGDILIEDRYDHLSNRIDVESGVKVKATTLDNLILELGTTDPDLIKINAEGAETAILRGATQSLKSKAHWAISCHDFIAHLPGFEASATHADVIARLSQIGLEMLPARVDARPWIPFYVYARPKRKGC